MSLITSSMNEMSIREYEKTKLPIKRISDETVGSLSKYLDFSAVDTNSYIITAKSYVGLIKLRDDLVLNILPKIKIDNLFIMLNYIYDIPFIIEEEVS